MFTGIVEETGRVLQLYENTDSWILKVGAEKIQSGMAIGDSVAVNGCCLTVTAFDANSVTFDLLAETVSLTSFDLLKEIPSQNQVQRSGSDVISISDYNYDLSVNLEQSLKFGGSMGGHFLTGHIDTTGKVTIFEQRGKDHYLRVEPPRNFLRYIVYKGSIAIDGVSLTVAEIDETGFAVWLIPHTLEVTNFKERQSGDTVNLEFDLLAKYVEKLLNKE